MIIYIDLFWAGVAVGAVGATALFIGLIVYIGIKNKGKKKGS